jgi:hypothetical protein
MHILLRFFLESLGRINKKYDRLWQQPTNKSRGNITGSGKGLEQWGWYVTLDNMSNSRPETWQFYYEMKLLEFLNLLLYYKDKEEYIEKIRQMNEMKARR